jgi:hypothetical protein
VGTAGTSIDATSLTITATNAGRLLGAGVAGTAIVEGIEFPPPIPPLTATQTGALPPALFRSTNTPLPPTSSAGFAGVTNYHEVKGTTLAYVNDAGTIDLRDGALEIRSADHTSIQALAGAASFTKTIANAAAIAGSFSANTLDLIRASLGK